MAQGHRGKCVPKGLNTEIHSQKRGGINSEGSHDTIHIAGISLLNEKYEAGLAFGAQIVERPQNKALSLRQSGVALQLFSIRICPAHFSDARLLGSVARTFGMGAARSVGIEWSMEQRYFRKRGMVQIGQRARFGV
jgi:hypothetical protein